MRARLATDGKRGTKSDETGAEAEVEGAGGGGAVGPVGEDAGAPQAAVTSSSPNRDTNPGVSLVM